MAAKAKTKAKNYIPPNNIEALRVARGWSQEALGAKLGMRGPNVDRLEGGLRRLDTGMLLKLCGVFDVSVDKITDLPIPKVNTSTADPVMLGLVVGWLIEACSKYKIDYDAKQVGKWTSYLYHDICDRDLPFDEARDLTFEFAKLNKSKKK